MRKTHTVVTLEVTPAFHKEVADALKQAGYWHVLCDGGKLLDMTGIGLVARKETEWSEKDSAAVRVSKALQGIADWLDDKFTRMTGARVGFSLFVWTEGRANYISNAPRSQVQPALQVILNGWSQGQPDTPAHKIN